MSPGFSGDFYLRESYIWQMKYLNINGKILAENEKVISINSRGVRYGDGLFETMKSRNGTLLLANDHFERLWFGMELLQFKTPTHFSAQKFQNEILYLLGKNGHHDLARIRLTVIRGDGGLFDEISNTPEYVIQTWPLDMSAEEWNSSGLVLGIYPDARKSCDKFSNVKHNNFLLYVMAALYAKKQKWNDAVVLNTEGNICDTAIANIFMVKDSIIYTPSLDEGCIAGVLRKNILSQLSANSIPVREAKITADDLLNADEVFLSNSIQNIRWVQSINGKDYSNAFTRKIYSPLLATIF